jgi:membrane protease subunit HflK
MAWNQPGNSNNNPWGKKPAPGGGDLDQALKDWQKRIEALFSGGDGGRSSTPLLVIGIIVLGGWMMTGLYQVQPGNQGVVQRFGKHVQTVGDGWGWRLPWPIETVTKVDVAGVKSTSYKSRVLTAEPNMVELQVAVQYRITKAEDYLFRVRDPIATLSEVSESAIREVVGRNDQQAILEAGRIKIAEDTRVIMQRTLDQYGAGIEVRSVNITDVQVPEAVQQAQRDSVKAKADRERMIKEAQAYANGILPKAQGDAARAVQEAEAYKSQVVLMATGDASRFSALAQAYEKAPNVTRERLYIETVESVLKGSRKVVIDSKSGNGNMIYLPLDKLLDRSRESDLNTVTVRPPAGAETDSPAADSRQRVER